jgi:MFS transporter, CP family, cyanate transporter
VTRHGRTWWVHAITLTTFLIAAFNSRTVIAAVSPIAADLSAGLRLDPIDLTLIGTLPPLGFAIFAMTAPALVRASGLERAMAIALGAIVVGNALRALVGSSFGFVAATVIALAGIGVANVLLPPLVRRHFAGRIGALTALYVTAQSIGTGAPALLGVPVSDTLGWRWAMGLWALSGVVGLVLWLAVVLRRAPRSQSVATPELLPAAVVAASGHGRVWRSPTGWAITALFAIAASHAYAAMAWLPQVLIEIADVTRGEAGALLGLFGAIGVLPALSMPVLASRVRNVGNLVHAGFICLLSGYLGLLLAASHSLIVVWVVLLGSGAAFFALCLVLVNLRTRTHAGTVRLSAFAQGIGYSVGALGPLAFGLLHDASGGWQFPLALFAGSTAFAGLAGLILRRPSFVEDEWTKRRSFPR